VANNIVKHFLAL